MRKRDDRAFMIPDIYRRRQCPVPSNLRQRQAADLDVSAWVARRWVIAGAGLPTDVRHFGLAPRRRMCHTAALTPGTPAVAAATGGGTLPPARPAAPICRRA